MSRAVNVVQSLLSQVVFAVALVLGLGVGTALLAAPTDFNGDAKSDVLLRDKSSGQISVMAMNGASVLSRTVFYTEQRAEWQIVGTGDFDGDRKSDVLWWNSSTGQVFMMLMNGSTIKSQGQVHQADTAWKIMAIADFTGDAKADILWRNGKTGEVFLMPMNGLSQLPGNVIYTDARPEWQIAGAADFDGDGKSDIVWWNGTTGDVYLLFMDGFSIKSQGTVYNADTSWMICGLGDFDGDGKADLLWRQIGTGAVHLLRLNGMTVLSGTTIYTEPRPEWQIVAIGDFDGDGKADILWWNSLTGQLYQLLMNGSVIKSQGMVYTLPSLSLGCAAPGVRPMVGRFLSQPYYSYFNLTGVFIGGTGIITPGNLPIASGGIVTVNPVGTTTYTITVTNGGLVQATWEVKAPPPPPPPPPAPVISLFQGTVGDGFWTLRSVFVGGTGVINPGNFAVLSGGDVTVQPTATTTYTLTVTSAAGGIARASTTLAQAPRQPKLRCTKTFIYGFGQLLSEETPAGTTYIQTDLVGSPNILTDPDGKVVGLTKNLPFGERFGSSGVQGSKRFTNHEDQPGSAIYMQARTYLPAYGKFAQPDPAYDQWGNDPETWNLFNYVANNPATSTDPTGLMGSAPGWPTNGGMSVGLAPEFGWTGDWAQGGGADSTQTCGTQ